MREITTAEAIREGLSEAMSDKNVFVLGEGAPDQKYIFGTTKGLAKDRVLDMPLSENAVMGILVGASLNGARPVMIHQRVDFALLCLDQLINNAAKWHYMFGGKKSVPLVLRLIIGRGWGQGAQHSQNLHSVFAHIPGLKVVMPSNAYDAKGMMISSIKDDNPVIFMEHRWTHGIKGDVPEGSYEVEIGKAKVLQEGKDITIVSCSYMTIEAAKAAKILQEKGISAEVIDLRTIKPLDMQTVIKSVRKTGRLLVVDSGYFTGGITSDIIAKVTDSDFSSLKQAPQRLTCPDYPAPSTPALEKYYYPRHFDIIQKVGEMLNKDVKSIVDQEIANMPKHWDVPDPAFTGPF